MMVNICYPSEYSVIHFLKQLHVFASAMQLNDIFFLPFSFMN